MVAALLLLSINFDNETVVYDHFDIMILNHVVRPDGSQFTRLALDQMLFCDIEDGVTLVEDWRACKSFWDSSASISLGVIPFENSLSFNSLPYTAWT